MTTSIFKQLWIGAAVSLCLWGAPGAFGQGRGGGGGGNFGGGGTGGGGFRGGGAASSSSSGTTRDYGNSTLPGDATISIDQENRRLVIMTDDATFASMAGVISNLDRPKPQVLINAVFLEVQHDDSLDIGLEGAYFHQPDAAHSLGISNIFNLQQLGAAGQQIGQTTMPPGAGMYSIAGQNFTATMRAIAANGKSQILSRPSVLVRNNQPATITVGQSIPLVTGVTFIGVNSQPLNTITYQNVGIILQVTPFITTDGLVEMIVAPQISSLSSTKVQITTGVELPAIDLRSASTVVVTPDGETVVIGGLMENDKTSVDSKIPILGDIPLLGAAFRHKQKSNTKTELLIFLTPHVVLTPDQLASASKVEGGKAQLAPHAFSDQELLQYGVPIKAAPPAGKNGKGGATQLNGAQ